MWPSLWGFRQLCAAFLALHGLSPFYGVKTFVRFAFYKETARAGRFSLFIELFFLPEVLALDGVL